jgi:membrane protein DedA with SNARE-associated domain
MEALETFLDTYGVAAASAIMLVKAIGVPIPIPGDVILLATAARAAEGKVVLSLAFAALLIAIVGGGLVQFSLARGPARQVLLRHGIRVGLTAERLDRVAAKMRRGGPLAIGVGVLTPGVRSAVIPACGLTGIPATMFVTGLVIGSAVDLALHFAIGYAGSNLLASVVAPAPVLVVIGLALVGLAAWLVIARRRHTPVRDAVNAWTQATCPVCLVVGNAVRLEGAA